MSETRLERLNYLFEKIDRIYRSYAGTINVPPNEVSVYYCLLDQNGTSSLARLKEYLSLPKQTLNSLMRSMEQAGLIVLSLEPGSKKSKQASLTPAGWKAAREAAGTMMQCEQAALDAFDEESAAQLFSLLSEYARHLEAAFAKNEERKETGDE